MTATRCLILRVGFGVKLSDDDIAENEGLRDIAMATNFGTKVAITGFVWTIVTRWLVMEGACVVGRQNADIADTLQLKASVVW